MNAQGRNIEHNTIVIAIEDRVPELGEAAKDLIYLSQPLPIHVYYTHSKTLQWSFHIKIRKLKKTQVGSRHGNTAREK